MMKYRNYIVNKVGFIEVENNIRLKAVFTAAGAGLLYLSFDGDVIINNALDEKTFLNYDNKFGKTTSVHLENPIIINGKAYSKNAEYDLKNLLFRCTATFQKSYFLVQFAFKKKKMLDGLPGKITYYVTYLIKDDLDELIVDYKALSNEKTPLFMSNEMVFVLDERHSKKTDTKSFENSKYRVEIGSNYDNISYKENPHGLVVCPKDNDVQCGYSFNKQISYKFVKK